MRAKFFTRNALRLLTLAAAALSLLLIPAGGGLRAASPIMVQPDIGINGFYSTDKAQRGRVIQAAVVVDIPGGYHINANRLIGKIGVPTSLKIDAPGGIKVGPVVYPRAIVRRLKVSDDQLALYEGRAVIRFNVTVPANYQEGVTELRARLRYQSCNDEVCFQPTTREITLPIGIVGPNDPVRRINGNIFGGGGRRKR
jgi:DsbC/DsbD-like thiol-disulfide interchange protein